MEVWLDAPDSSVEVISSYSPVKVEVSVIGITSSVGLGFSKNDVAVSRPPSVLERSFPVSTTFVISSG